MSSVLAKVTKRPLGNIGNIGSRLSNINEGATPKYRFNFFDEIIYLIAHLDDTYNFSSILTNKFFSTYGASVLLCTQ